MAWWKIWTVIDIISTAYQASKWAWNFASDENDEEIEKEFKNHIKEYIQKQVIKFKKEINQKTIIYICWSLMGILLLNISFAKPIYYIGLSLMVIIFLYSDDIRSKVLKSIFFCII